MKRILHFAFRLILTFTESAKIFLLWPFSRRYRKALWRLAVHTGIVQKLGDTGKDPQFLIPLRQLSEFNICRSTVAYPAPKDGNISLLELMILNEIILKKKPMNIFEIGTFDGRTTLNFALNSPGAAKIHTLDLPSDREVRTTFPLEEAEKPFVRNKAPGELFSESVWAEAKKIQQFFGDSAAFNFSSYWGTMDFVFVDGSHQYDFVKNDSQIALRLCAEQGVIVWHDYAPGWPGVMNALHELFQEVPFSGMVRLENTSLVMLELTRQEDRY